MEEYDPRNIQQAFSKRVSFEWLLFYVDHCYSPVMLDNIVRPSLVEKTALCNWRLGNCFWVGLSHTFVATYPIFFIRRKVVTARAVFCAVYPRAQFWASCCSPCIPSPWPVSSIQVIIYITFMQMVLNCTPPVDKLRITVLFAYLMLKSGPLRTNLI